MQPGSELEQRMLDRAIYHQTNRPQQAQSTDGPLAGWRQPIHAHLLRATMPKLTAGLVGYWLTSFLWGCSAAQPRGGCAENISLYREGAFGSGYSVVTLSSLYIVSLQELTTGRSAYDLDTVSKFWNGVNGEAEQLQLLAEDDTLVIPLDAILDASVLTTVDGAHIVVVRTARETIHLFAHLAGEYEEIATAIRMAKSGKLAALLGRGKAPATEVSRPPAANEDAVDQLRQLKVMLDLKLITEKEYEEKKAEILARM